MIDTAPLAAAFRDMTTSYKAFWFLALLDAVKARPVGTVVDRFVSFGEMYERMLAAAFWPAVRYRLSFGKVDQIHKRLAGYRSDEGSEELPDMKSERDDGILRYVPQRFLAPWLSPRTAGIPDSSRDATLVSLAAAAFAMPGAIPYRVQKDGILMDPSWHAHLFENVGIMKALGERELIRFLQARNPTVPGIPDKISDARRRSLADQSLFWKAAVEDLGLRCFYSDQPMGAEFSLDHFVPWSFVVHDRIWNLVPARRSINSSKGVRIPDERFVDDLCDVHLRAVRNAMERGGDFSASSLAVDYETDLRIDLTHASDDEIIAAHRDAILPLVILARRSGFTGGWRHHLGKTV